MEENGNITLTDERAEGEDPENNNGTEEINETNIEDQSVNISDDRKAEREEYDKLIKTRFKDFYTEDTQRMINRRFRHYKALAEKYKVLEESVASANETVSLTRDEIVDKIRSLEGELTSKYPSFSLEEAQRSDQFMALAKIALESGSISLSQAYKLSHFDEILKNEREKLEKEIEQKVTERIRANRARASENAVLPQIRGSGLKVSRLTKTDRADLAKRAAKGEKIGF